MSFNICVVKTPVRIFDERRQCEVILWNESAGDRVLDFNFEGDDFNALQNFLDIKFSEVEQREGESYSDYDERLRLEYLEAAKEKGFPMLGRFWYWYDCATYFPSEIPLLRAEGLRLKDISQNSVLTKAMDKILTACDEAAKTNSGLEFASD